MRHAPCIVMAGMHDNLRFGWWTLTLAMASMACGDGFSVADDDGAGGATSSSSSTASSGAGAQQSTCLEDEEATQKVTLAITNDTNSDRFVAIEADQCAPWGLAQEEEGQFQPFPMGTGYPCGCECPAPPLPHVSAYQRIAAGSTFELVWDARRRIGCTHTEDCGDGFSANIAAGFLRPVGGGQFRITLGIESMLDAERCNETAQIDYWRCNTNPPTDATGANGVCTSATMLDVDFVLETAEITVPVSLE